MKQNKIVPDLGIIYIVATPIGNLADISQRAIDTLQLVDRIAVEDTRHSAKLLRYLKISKPLFALCDINEKRRVDQLLEQVNAGKSIALISDAGTPLISDPGYRLIERAHDAGIKVVPIPGACAAIVALSAAGLPTDKFIFEGFLPAKSKARLARLQQLQKETRTLIFYESPHRINASLTDMMSIFGAERQATMARELTKIHETIYKNNLKGLLDYILANENQLLGEFVVLVRGEEGSRIKEGEDNLDKLLRVLLKEVSIKKAIHITAELTGERKNKLYKLALGIKGEDEY